MLKPWLLLVVFAVSLFAASVAQATSGDPRALNSSYATQSAALSKCQSDLAWVKSQKWGVVNACTLAGTSSKGGWSATLQCYFNNQDYVLYATDYTGPYDYHWCYGQELPTCTAGKSSWPTDAWSDGVDCSGGCYVVPTFQLDTPTTYTETGEYCPGDTTAKIAPPTQSSTPPPETCNPDGSCTYCANGYCVTSTQDPPAPPAPATSGGNGSTSSQTSTTTPASTSSTTTTSTSTTTTTGGGDGTGGTGGTGDSTGTTTGTSTSTTTTPASTSTSSSNCTTGVCDVGEADGSIGGLYRNSVDTPESVFSTYMTQVKSAPIVAAATGFFTVQASGSCPSWHIPGNDYWGRNGFDFTFFCDSAMLALFQIAGWLVLAGGAFCAFRIAVY